MVTIRQDARKTPICRSTYIPTCLLQSLWSLAFDPSEDLPYLNETNNVTSEIRPKN